MRMDATYFGHSLEIALLNRLESIGVGQEFYAVFRFH